MSLFDALVALRDAPDPAHPALGWAWREVHTFVSTRLRGASPDADDIGQLTLWKVMKGVRNVAAETPAGAEAWLRQVHRSAVADHHRKRDPVKGALDRGDERGPSVVERLAAPEPERREDDEARLDTVTEALMDRVEDWLAVHVSRPSKRRGDRQRAQVAWMANVLGKDTPTIATELGLGQSRDTLYKWIERGREQVLLPVITAWEAESEDATVPREIRSILESTRRADAGKPRPDRRSVSRESEATSETSNTKSTRGSKT